MKELSLHILDLVQNCIEAGADNIGIEIDEDITNDIFRITVTDNGWGMSSETIENVKDPFFTSRKTRRIGLGIPLLYEAARRCGGDMEIKSESGHGTYISVYFIHSHIDRAPLGDIWDTLAGLIMCNEHISFTYIHKYDGKLFEFKTEEIIKTLNGVPITEIEVIGWIRQYLKEQLNELYGGMKR